MEEKVAVAREIKEGVGGEGRVADHHNGWVRFALLRGLLGRQGGRHGKWSLDVFFFAEAHHAALHIRFSPAVGRRSGEGDKVPVCAGLLIEGDVS